MEFTRFTIQQYDCAYQIMLNASTYGRYGNIYVSAYLLEEGSDEAIEEFCTFTVNVEDLPYGQAAIDVPNQDGMDVMGFLEKNQLGERTGRKVASGECDYPVFQFNLEQLEKDACFEGKGLCARKSVKVGLIEVGRLPRIVEISADGSGSYLKALQGLVGGDIEYFTPMYAEEPALVINEEGLFTCIPNRAVYANARMVKCGYLDQMRYDHPVEEGELYTVLYGDIVAVSHALAFVPSTGEYESVERDISYEEFERLWKDFSDTSSAFKEIAKIKASKS